MTAPASAISTATTIETRAGRAGRRRRRWTRFILPAYSWLVIAYLVFPIAVMILYSFNKVTTGLPQVSFAWNGFTLQWYREWSNVPGLTAAFWLSIRLAILSTLFSTVIGTLLALALVRYQAAALPRQDAGRADDVPQHRRARDRARGLAARPVCHRQPGPRLRHAAAGARRVQHRLRRGHGPGADDRLRPVAGGGRAGPRGEFLGHLPRRSLSRSSCPASWPAR